MSQDEIQKTSSFRELVFYTDGTIDPIPYAKSFETYEKLKYTVITPFSKPCIKARYEEFEKISLPEIKENSIKFFDSFTGALIRLLRFNEANMFSSKVCCIILVNLPESQSRISERLTNLQIQILKTKNWRFVFMTRNEALIPMAKTIGCDLIKIA